MRSKQAIAFFSILLVALGLFTSAVVANRGGETAGLKAYPAVNTVINFPSFPDAGGPYMVRGTVRPATVSVGGVALGAPDVLLVFNEDLDPLSVATTDFIAPGFTFSGVVVSGNTVQLTGVAGQAAGDVIRLAELEAVEGVDGSLSKDLTNLTLGAGPVITSIDMSGHTDTLTTNEVFTVTFDADVTYGAGDTEDTAFGSTPEYNGAALETPVGGDLDNSTTLTFNYVAPPGPHPLQIQPGITHLILASGRIRWEDDATENSTEQRQVIENQGPHVVSAYYNDVVNILTVVMSEPIDPVNLAAGATSNFSTGGGFSLVGANVTLAAAGEVTNILQITDLAAPPDQINDAIGNNGAVDLTDFLGDIALADNQDLISIGPGIMRASFDDRQTGSRADDNLYIWLSEETADLTDIDLDCSDFDPHGFTFTGCTVTDRRNENDLTRITIQGFTQTNWPRHGSRINAVDDGTIITGDETAEAIDLVARIPVIDESRPYALVINENADFTYDRWNAIAGIDSIFVAWTETNGTEGEDYFLFFTKESPVNITSTWMNTYLSSAIPLGDPRPQVTNSPTLTRAGFLIDPGVTMTTDGVILQEGDQIYVLVAAADLWGNISQRGDLGNNAVSNHLFGAFLVGPLCPPRDFISDVSLPAEADSADWDHDVIHIVGDSLSAGVVHYIYGDEGAIPCDADSVVVFDGDDPFSDTQLGGGPVGPNGSFDLIELAETDPDVVNCVWVFSKSGLIDYSTGTRIYFQRDYATIAGSAASPHADFVFDPWNPYRTYNANDYINIRFLGARPFTDCDDGGTDVPLARSALLHAWADFTQIDATGGNISGFSTPADSILFTSLGADLVDNDGDWANSQDLNDDGTIDASELFDDVGLDGVAGTNDQGEGDGVPTYGDPWVDENGNGVYDAGETFLDRVNDVDKGDHIFDPGEIDLDSNDPDEFGWYEVRSSDASVRGTVRQGYRLANPIAAAMLDPYTPVPIWIEDNGIDGEVRSLFPATRNLPYTEVACPNDYEFCYNRTLFHIKEHNGGDPERRFAAVLDLREPTVSEFSYLANEGTASSDGAANLIVPGNPVYNLGRFVDWTSANLSDRDVLYNNMRLRIGTSTTTPSGSWQNLTLDPGPQSGNANSDANLDGFPGGEGYDEDADSTAADGNGFDEDEDGNLDAADDGEGIDFSDREVHAAAQDSTQDAGATNTNGLHCMNDYTDNDNDAFFVYDSYANGGLSAAPFTNIGRIYWYNIDESRSNNFDDDNDGQTDENDETPENVGYGTGVADDNEDGIANGEAVEVPVQNIVLLASTSDCSFLAIGHDPFGLGLYAPPVPGPGVDASVVRVDAAHILGRRPVNGNDARNLPFYANELAYGEVVDAAYENMTYSTRTFPSFGYDLGGAADSTSGFNRTFNWADTHAGDNVDWELLATIYGMTDDGATIHQIRANAYDKAGNVDELWSEPISFTLDLDAPLASIPGCDTDDDGDNDGDPPADFADVSPAAGLQVYDAGKHPQPYTLTATADDDAVSVTFEASFDPEFDSVDFTATDNTAPFTAEWPSVDGMYTINNYPAANADTVYFRAIAEDEFGNQTQEEDFCVLTVIVIDGTNPTTVITQIDEDTDLHDGACVAPDSSINIFANAFDNDEDLGPDGLEGTGDENPLHWVAGLDVRSGDAGVDDDGDLALLSDGIDNDGDLLIDEADEGGIDEDDVDGDGIFTAGIDVAGPDGIPGTNDDEWNGSDSGAGNLAETDDYITNDIVKVIFEFNPVDDVPDQGWLPIETVHGDPYSDPPNVIDWTQPVKATWNTLDLPTGNYDLRAWSCDIEGNCDSTTAFITTVCIRNEPLRAYIQPEVCTAGLQFDLYALHFIHDYEIDKVRFEYYFDANGDGCANDGNSWVAIDTDDDVTGRGDAVLYWPVSQGGGDDADPIEDLTGGYREDLAGTNYRFWDPENDGYSSRDPVVYDNGDGIFHSYDDDEILGEDNEIPEGVVLTAFQADEFFVDTDDEELSDGDWIFRENELEGDNNQLDLWTVTWDATGLPEGNYLTWAIAIDETNQEDVITYTCYDPTEQNPEELELVRIDTVLPDANLVTITLPDGTELDVSTGFPTPYISGATKWIKLCAEGDADIARLLFEYSLDGGVSYYSLDVNNDDDFYADVNDTLGAQVGEWNEDELFNDLNGNFEYDGPEIDFVRSPGADGDVDTPLGWPLLPLSSEDPLNDQDDDFDGVVDEDPSSGTPPQPGSPEDYEAPFCVYLDITSLPLWTDVNVLFRATAYDQVCDIYRPDETPDILAVIIGENMPPEADIVRAEDLDGLEVDLRPEIMDDDGCDTFGADTDTVRVFVTAEDTSSIDRVELWYRLDPACYPDLTFEEMQWRSMIDDGYTEVDAVYPYDFDVATDPIPNGSYQVYPRAYDETGNYNPAPENPWCFKKFDLAGVDFAFVSDPAPPPAPREGVAPGDEFVIEAQLIDPSHEPTTAVSFYYAERILDESIDATRVQPLAPFISEALNESVLSEVGSGDGVELTINGTVATFHEDLGSVVGPTKFDYTVDLSTDQVIFGARPDGTDEILIDYNIGEWMGIYLGDEFAPYTVAWDAEDGGVPERYNPAADAYDLIAIAHFDVNGDGEFDGDGKFDGFEGCDASEPLASEGNYILLEDQERPLVKIWGLDWSDDNPEQQWDYPDWNTPGNPLFNSGDNIQNYDYVAKLSGVETDVFVTAEDEGGGSIDSVSLTITAEALTANATPVVHTYAMSEYGNSASYIDIPVTFYERDYTQWTPESLENVILLISTNGGDSFDRQYEMTDMGEFWQATGRFDVDTDHHYLFLVDLVGDLQEAVVDARNNGVDDDGSDGSDGGSESNRPDLRIGGGGVLAGGYYYYSALNVPETPFWYVHIDNVTDLTNNAVHQAVATAWDDSGNSGNNLNSAMPDSKGEHQGQVVFIHDRTEPVVQDILAFDDDGRPLVCDRVSPQEYYSLVAVVSDFPFTDLNILAVESVLFQYSPNGGEAWLDIGWTDPYDDGGFHVEWNPTNGEGDGYDNDGDGLWDEEDERVYTAQIRAIAFDDGYNSTYSDRQLPPVVWSITVDAAEPTASLVAPLNGQVFGFDESIQMAGTPQGDWLPSLGESDIDHVRFQVRMGAYDGSMYYVDQPGGHDGYYDNGIDEIWADADHNDLQSGGDTPLYPGIDGSFDKFSEGPANFWFDLDPTPQDNSDLPRLDEPNNGAEYRLSWIPNDYIFARGYIDEDTIWQVDEYVRGRMLTTDCAGNEDTDGDGFPPPWVLFLLNDDTTPRAYIIMVDDEIVDPIETLAIQALDPIEIEGTVGPNCYQVSRVNLFMEQNGTVTLIGADLDDSVYEDCAFSLHWNAETLPEGEYVLFATTVDEDGNESSRDEATRVRVRIDRTAPSVVYDVDGPWFDGFVQSRTYVDDGILDHSSLVILPDADTQDVLFQVATPDADVETVMLQWRYVADPVGVWRDFGDLVADTNGSMERQTNLDYTPGGGMPLYVWWLHVEDWADNVYEEGPMQFRALATDEAGNSNFLQVPPVDLTVDATDPTLFDWNDDSVTNHVGVGGTVNFEITTQDLEHTDVHAVQLQFRKIGDPDWIIHSADEAPTGVQIDTDNGMWVSNFAWVAPDWVVRDTAYEFRIIVWDKAGNEERINHPNEFAIIVDDDAAPDRTKIIGLEGLVYYVDDYCDDLARSSGDLDASELNQLNWEVWAPAWPWNAVSREGAALGDDYDDIPYYTPNDFLISEGEYSGIAADDCDFGIAVGDVCNTYPRDVDESYLTDENVRNEVRIARTVTVVGRTWADDESIDDGIAYVVFQARRLDDAGNVIATYDLGKDEYAPFFPLYYWHLVWNTLEVDLQGNRVYPDGRYQLAAWATDEEGNVEDTSSLEWTGAIVVIDNTGLTTQMDADATTPAVEKTVAVQRNSDFTLFARTLLLDSNTVVNDEDAEVTFWFKRSRDLNMADSWGMVDPAAGVDAEDGNPDPTRPYSFDVKMGWLTDPTDDVNDPPLVVGETYDFIASVQDAVCNETDHLTMFDDSNVAGVETRHITIEIIDTIAPCLEITATRRQLATDEELGDSSTIPFPTRVHARGLQFIEARLLTGDRDLDHVEFVYRQQGTSTWNLIDADLIGSEDRITWTLGSWDLRTLQHNTWYEVAAVGVDNVGNVCQNPDIMLVYVDYEAPPTDLVSPGEQWCPEVDEADGDDLDLIVHVERGAQVQHDDVYRVQFEFKTSDSDSTEWEQLAGGYVGEEGVNYDDITNRYSAVLDMDALSELEGLCIYDRAGDGGAETQGYYYALSGLYDLRVRVIDEAGNVSTIWTWKNIVDLDEPDVVQISNITWDGMDTTQDPNDGGQYTDVTAGTRVVIHGTASDDEFCLPNEPDPVTNRYYETGIAIMQFQVAVDLPYGAADGDCDDGEVWQDLGVREFDPSDFADGSAQSDSVLWNTTGLDEGEYFIRVGVKDECNNPSGSGDYTWSEPANVRITDSVPPIARIACWDSDLQLHGDNPPSRTCLYALAESDPSIVGVQFQYNVRTAGENTPVGEWVNIGIASEVISQDSNTTETVWTACISLDAFDPSITRLWLRALAEDDAGNRYGDNPEDVVPTISANIVELEDGMLTLEAERAADQQNGAEVVEYVRTQIVSPVLTTNWQVNVEVKMASADETPRVLILGENNDPESFPEDDDLWNISAYVDEDGHMIRSIDDPTVWRGYFDLDSDDDWCTHYTICVTGLDNTAGIAQWIDMDHGFVREYGVNEQLGTNGTVSTPAYDDLHAAVTVIPGAWEYEGCMLVGPTYAPLLSHDQMMYLQLVDETAYHIELVPGGFDRAAGFQYLGFRDGYHARVVIEYSEAAVAAALEGTQATEADLTARRYFPDEFFDDYDGNSDAPLAGGGGLPNQDALWTASGISHIHVDTEANTVTFYVDDLTSAFGYFDYDGEDGYYYGSDGNIFALFVPTGSGPVSFASVEPVSPYVNDWWTDVDPEFVAYLKEQSGQIIDPESVELLIDGEFWATWFDPYYGGDYYEDELIYANYVRGNGEATLEFANRDLTVMELRYDHSGDPRDWLAEGEHTLTIRYMGSEGDEWVTASRTFYVDRTPPYVEFDGGWVTNPRLLNLAGYMNPANDSLQVKLYDGGSGILFKDLTYGDSYGYDREVKYDLWLVHHEDDQNDIDEIEERVLLHPGTADELEPWIHPRLADYNPATDTLRVPVPVLGGGRIRHNDVIEIVWYSDKYIEANSDGVGFGCDVDTLVIEGEGGDDDDDEWDIDLDDEVILVYGRDCTYDSESQEMHVYQVGIRDWADNSGSRYVEQRFIVDMRPPSCEIVNPAATVTPDGDLYIEVHFSDDGAGLDPNTVDVIVYGPDGEPVEVSEEQYEDGVYTALVEGPLDQGEYSVQVRSADLLGNRCSNSKTIRVESAVLAMTGAVVFPNPFNPEEVDAGIHFTLSKASDVTAKVYDFGGNYVATLASLKPLGAGAQVVSWAGESSDHTDLANGSYIVRLTATDGNRTEEANLKVVLWRE